ncbi:hypothetical protein HBDW_11240 [Herbaspirillum sp. DW155]|uniref:hypothetical protein n=1 Tax=Herbaspirillum sp. DW155 TaxID=3095609 RepID=UPI003091F220|nr:hypothetical protein HBDW_11240 [Herbaspirillum sp. DW155]
MSTKKSAQKINSVCRLTRTSGVYVKSHLLPLALTRLSLSGEKFFEAGHGHGRRKVSSSWYDQNLTTRLGEDILAKIDSAGIKELRKLRLIWSGWESHEHSLRSDEVISWEDQFHLRELDIEAPDVLRVFFLSLLWRAAASTRAEFSDIKLSEEDLEDLRLRVVEAKPGKPEDYPLQFHQIFTRGEHHNRTPIMENQTLPEGELTSSISYVRFYFDGLVTNIYLARHTQLSDGFLRLCVGFKSPTLVIAHKYGESRAERELEEIRAIGDGDAYKRLRQPRR